MRDQVIYRHYEIPSKTEGCVGKWIVIDTIVDYAYHEPASRVAYMIHGPEGCTTEHTPDEWRDGLAEKKEATHTAVRQHRVKSEKPCGCVWTLHFDLYGDPYMADLHVNTGLCPCDGLATHHAEEWKHLLICQPITLPFRRGLGIQIEAQWDIPTFVKQLQATCDLMIADANRSVYETLRDAERSEDAQLGDGTVHTDY